MENVTALELTAYEKFGEVGQAEYEEAFIDENLDADEIDLFDYFEYLSERYSDECFYSMDEFDEICSGMKPWEVARACFYSKHFCPADEYFKFNAYANIESMDEWQIRKEASEDTDFLHWYMEKNGLIDWDEAQEVIDQANELIRKGY